VSAPFAVVVFYEGARRDFDAFGPLDEDEADALVAQLRTYGVDANAVLLRGWIEDDFARRVQSRT
jgi:hypothetical protein